MSDIPTLTPLDTTPPNRSMEEDDYVPAADAFAAWMPVIANEWNDAAVWANAVFEAVASDRQTVVEATANTLDYRDQTEIYRDEVLSFLGSLPEGSLNDGQIGENGWSSNKINQELTDRGVNDWATQAGPASAGLIYKHQGRLWELAEAVDNIAAEEPAINSAKWQRLAGDEVGGIVFSYEDLTAKTNTRYVRPGMTYLQADYPELFSVIGVGSAGHTSKITGLNEAPAPGGIVNSVALSDDNQYFAAGHSSSTAIYKRNGDIFNKLPDPAQLYGRSYDAAFSTGAEYLALALELNPYIAICKRDGDAFNKLSPPNATPPGVSYSAAFSADGQYLAVAHNGSPYITIYKRDGDTFNKLSNPVDLPPSTGYGVAFSADGQYLAVAHNGSPYITIYKRDGDTFNKLPNPSELPAGTGNGVAFSADSQYLAVAHNAAPFITIYKRDGDTFNKLPNPSDLPANTGNGVAFSEDGQHMSVAHDNSPYMTVYSRSGDMFSKLPNSSELPPANCDDILFSADSQYMAVAYSLSSGSQVFIYVKDYPFNPATEFLLPDVPDFARSQIGAWNSISGNAYVRAK